MVRKRIPVILDSGVRRGTDVFKAIAFGQAGVERVLGLLRAELRNLMAFAGAGSLADGGSATVVRAN